MACPVLDCGQPTLGIDNGHTDVSCTSCGGRWTQQQYDWLANLLISDHQSREADMLKWLLYEANWKMKRDGAMLHEVRRLASMSETDLAGIDGVAVVELLREILNTKKAPVTSGVET
jgi:hypothetical protein